MADQDKRICKNALDKLGVTMSKTVKDYYLKYGQNRDLDKYLRFRPSVSTRSSSEGSIQACPEKRDECNNHLGKSIDSLTCKDNCHSFDPSGRNKTFDSLGSLKSDKNKSKSPKATTSSAVCEDDKPKNFRVSLKNNEKAEDKKKCINFNVESSIEIFMPPQTVSSQEAIQCAPPNTPALSVQEGHARHSHRDADRIVYLHSSETQTTSKSPEQEELIKPIVKTPRRSSKQQKDLTDNVSPPESLQSNRQRLEWDSLADIGYCKDKYLFCGANELSEKERDSLLSYFQSRGINFERSNVVILKNNEKKDKMSQSTSMDKLDLIDYSHELDKVKKTRAISKADAATCKEKWQNVYKKYTEKYKSQNATIEEASVCNIDDPTSHSTPYSQPASVIAPHKGDKQQSTSNSNSMRPPSSKSTETRLDKLKNLEKQYCNVRNENADKASQTSSVFPNVDYVAPSYKVASTQINPNSLGRASRSNDEDYAAAGIELDDDGNCTIANSFEFLAGSIMGRQNKENIQPCLSKRRAPKVSLKFDNMSSSKDPTTTKSTNGNSSSSLISILSTKSDSNLVGKTQSFDDELRMAIQLMSSLLDSKSMTTDVKKCLINKIITKIVNVRLQSCKNTNNSSSSSTSLSRKSNSKDYDSVSLEPLGASDPALPKPGASRDVYDTVDARQTSSQSSELNKEYSSAKDSVSVAANSKSSSRESAVQECLQPITHSEVDYEMHNREKRPSGSRKTTEPLKEGDKIKVAREERICQLKWIEKEIKHLSDLKKMLTDTGSCGSSAEKIYENLRTREYSPSTVNTSTKDETSVRESDSVDWDSHKNLKKMMNHRSKLQTPQSPDSSIVNFIKDRKEQFIQKYDKSHGRFFSSEQKDENGENVYTKPYSSARNSSENYGEAGCSAGNYRRVNQKNGKTVQQTVQEKDSTSISAGSDAFLSSNSISIPMQNTMTNTTTHQYDMKDSDLFPDSNQCIIGTQTSDTLLRTRPIVYEPNQNTKTRMVNSCQLHKQQQTAPNPVSYTLTFDKAKNKQNVNAMNKITRDNMRTSDNRKSSAQQCKDNRGASTSISPPTASIMTEDELSLHQHLRKKRPKVLSNMDDRSKCISELKKLREKRNEQRKKLLLLTSETCLKDELHKKLPPAPITQKRVFTTKALKLQTLKQFKKLPEVRLKKEIEKENNLKRKNRIISDIFNKNLQKNCLKGKINLSNSGTNYFDNPGICPPCRRTCLPP